MAQETQPIPTMDPVHLGFSEQRQPVLRGDSQHHIVARGDQLAFAAEVVRFGFAPDDFALEIARVRGKRDPHGYRLRASYEAVADELACAAGLVCGKLNQTPACVIRGFRFQQGAGVARELLRPAENDLFR